MEQKVFKTKRGSIHYAYLPETFGSVQHGWRPVVIVSNEFANGFSSVKTVVPLTTSTKSKSLPTHVHIKSDGVIKSSIALCEQIMSVSDLQFKKCIGHVPEEEMIKVDFGILMQIYLKKRNNEHAQVKIGNNTMAINLLESTGQVIDDDSAEEGRQSYGSV